METFFFFLGVLIFSIAATHIVYRWTNPKEKEPSFIDQLPNKPIILPPPPPVSITIVGGGGGAGGSGKAYGTNGIVPITYGHDTIYSINGTSEKLTIDQVKKMQKELENHLFSNLARPHHKIPILEPFGLPKRKEENHEPIEEPKRKITY